MTPSTSYGVQTRRRILKFSLGVQAERKEGAGRERRDEVGRDEVSELESALGIDNKTVRNVSADKNGPPRRLFVVSVVLCVLHCVASSCEFRSAILDVKLQGC